MTKGLEPFPSKNAWKRYLDYMMYGVGFIAPLALVPQILQLYTSKSSVGLSLSTWVLFVGVNSLWALYGAVHKDKQLFLANILVMLFNLTVVIGILMY
ncbi:MAG: SemiSWEET family transporter [bacterium]|nr:SemiSWEET family transporter [bacterium]